MTQRASLKTYLDETKSMSTLVNMLTTCRPEGSKVEKQFIRAYIAPLGAMPDGKGNYVLRIGNDPIMWSCHTDTVHTHQGSQDLKRIGQFTIGLADKSKSNCLGADDTAGVWLMREMILAQKPGLYIFHRSEEVGCVGSKWLAKNNSKLLEGIKYAVAFDRKGTTDVITNQMGRCCSDEFAESLAAQLGMGYKPSPNGVYTDTKSYVDLIGECTNISVGYYAMHSSSETLDAEFLAKLKQQVLGVNVSKLTNKRKPAEVDPEDAIDWSSMYGGGRHSYRYFSDDWVAGVWDHGTREWRAGYFKSKEKHYGSFACFEEYIDEYYGTDRYGHRDVMYKPQDPDVGIPVKAKEKPQNVVPFAGHSAGSDNRGHNGSSHVTYGNNQRELDQILETVEDSDEEAFSLANSKLTLENLVRNHPEEVADYLEQYGVDAVELAVHIHEVLGYVRTKY